MAGGRIWTEEEKRLLRDAYANNIMTEVIAEKIGRSKESVWKQAFRMGITTKFGPAPYTFTDDQKAKIEHDYDVLHKSAGEIAEAHGVSRRVILKYLHARGKARTLQEANQVLNKGRERVIPFPELHRLYFDECYSVRALQRHFGCGYSTLIKNFDRHGLALIPQHERKKMRAEFKDKGKVYTRLQDKTEAIK